MPEVFFIGDTHFGHANILTYEPQYRQHETRFPTPIGGEQIERRPFTNIDEHDEYLVTQWNNIVGEKDIVYVLGDFCFGKHNIAIANCLNGKKRLIMGNHDIYPAEEYLKYFEKLYGALFYKGFLLSHIPVHPHHARAIANIHGHLHSHNVSYTGTNCVYINVSCEQIALRPISMDQVKILVYQKWDRQ